MNVAGHITVALRLHPDDPAVWLGAALPDLAAMGGFRLLGATDDEDVTLGIALHHRTDDAFHRHQHFTAPMGRLRSDLADDGISRGPARAVAHVGPELLLDGELLEDDAIGDAVTLAFDQILDLGPALAALVDDGHRRSWLHHLRKVPTWGLPPDYADPHAVAGRLHRILSRRPRLAFDPDQIGPVADRLADEQPTIVANAPELLGDLVDELS